MKKIFICVVMILCLCQKVNGESLNLTPNAGASILIEANSKEVLYKKNEKEKLYPASTTKIMTMILMFEAINKGSLKWDEVLTCSSYASSMGGSQVYLETGEKMSVSDLFKSIAIASANDACVMIGERIGGSIDNFVDMMNNKATELKLTNTHFKNATGLHDDDHYTCALDLSTMAAYLIKIGGDKLLSVTSLYDSYIREDTAQKFWLVNTNKLLKSYEGNDGLKTGYTKEAGYCIVSTAKRNGLRLIAVVLKEEKPKVRNEEVSQLLDYGFSLYESKLLYSKNDVVDKVKIENSKEEIMEVIVKEDIYCLQSKENQKEIDYKIQYNTLIAPMSTKDIIGYLNVYRDKEKVGVYPLYLKSDVHALTYLKKLYIYFIKFV
jgi:D-alanyl-D-alanine carboxypeptidase (penicillin-binding protein 5/6)